MADPVFRSAYDFLAPSPDANYGSVLPFAYNREGSGAWVQEGSNPRLAMPEWLRSAMQGVVGLGESTQTGNLTPEALATLTMGSVGTGATLGVRGALASGASRPIRAYHGSPHSFDRFDLSKIGTGEGGQAFGHGLYFAENEGVARSYKKAGDYATREVDVINGQLSRIAREMDQYHGGQYGKYTDPKGYELKAQYDALMAKRSDLGHMYEVGIHTDPAKMLNYDKPLIQQPYVAEKIAAQNIAGGADDAVLKQTGAQWYNTVTDPRLGEMDPQALSQMLAEARIPGIKYLDQGSRTAGQGSSNYVVFDPATIEILRKYGFAVPSPAVPGFSVVPPSQQPLQQPGFRVAKDMVF